MEQLTIIGSEESALILADETGQRYTLAVNDVLRSEIRKATRERTPVKPLGASPREIQTHIRAGMAAEEVSRLLSIDIESVRRFEGPVLAEREHIVNQALSVPVVMAADFDVDENPTFGSAIRAKLDGLSASGERWTSWKDDSGWTVKLEFTASDVDHDARWSFEPRRSALSPLNSDATQLSQQGPLPEGLIPRLRALDTPAKDLSQFDSNAFGPRAVPDADAGDQDEASDEMVSGAAVRDAATKRAPESSTTTPETADLLEALRRRRGQREAAPMDEIDESASRHPARGSAPVSLFDAAGVSYKDGDQPAPVPDDAPKPEPVASAASHSAKSESESSASRRRSGRASMPSWDEIVFGAKTDD